MSVSQGDLARATVHDPNDDWPTHLEIVAYWSRGNGRRGKRRSITIEADHFFGRGRYGAPMSAEVLFGMVEKLRRQGPLFGKERQSKARTPGGARWGVKYGIPSKSVSK